MSVETEVISYPCPNCGTYTKPYMHVNGYAYMLCPKCNVQYKTSTKVSANFRKLCSRVASNPTRSQGYYTSSEKKVKAVLDKLGLREGIDYVHNCRVKNGRTYYYPDFLLHYKRIIIEVSPSIWHTRWNREDSERKKKEFFKQLGFTIVELGDEDFKRERLEAKLKEVLG